MEIQNISGADYIPTGFTADSTPREETHTRSTTEDSIEREPVTETGRGQTIDTYA